MLLMNRVHCLLNGEDITAGQFNSMNDEKRELYRDNLVCIACGRRATFRRVSAKRTPTFAAQHKDGCILTSKTWSAFRYLQ